MTSNSTIHHRRSMRLPGWDYAQAGTYFITTCAHNREHLFGEIVDGEMILNEIGMIVRDEWIKTSAIRLEIKLGEFVVMPNHVHGIIIIHDSVGAYGHAPLQPNTSLQTDKPLQPNSPLQTDHMTCAEFRSPSKTIGSLVRGYKSAVKKRTNILRATPGVPVWQRNYYEPIIRDEKTYMKLSEYLENNPSQWPSDHWHMP